MPLSRLSRLFSAVCLLGVSSLAHADTLQQFFANNINFSTSTSTPVPAGSLTGSIVVNTTLGQVTSSALQFNAVGGTTYTFYSGAQAFTIGVTEDLFFLGSAGTRLDLYIPGNLVNYMGGEICRYPAQPSCVQPNPGGGTAPVSQSSLLQIPNGNRNTYYDASSGSLTPYAPVSAATPEPSSLLLLSTGALGAAGVLRRRFAVGHTS